MRKTKIIATVSGMRNFETLRAMFKTADCARINLSHGTIEEYSGLVRSLRKLETELKKQIPILFDLSGPKVRVTALNDEIPVAKGDRLFIGTKKERKIEEKQIMLNFPQIVSRIKTGQRLYIDDGRIRFRVRERAASGFFMEALTGGIIRKNKGVNLPDTDLPLPSLTAKDLRDIDTVKKLGGDFIALSFVRKEADVKGLKRILKKKGMDIPVISKIERPEVLKVLDEVVEASDGVMVARGDLGVELSLEKVPVWQKKIINLCREKGRHVIVATQILETMVEKPEPTRAEVSDIANAIYDGCDALMLSGETATGSYPVESLATLDVVARETERNDKVPAATDAGEYRFLKGDTTSAIAFAAFTAARSLDARGIACFTATGQTAGLISKFRPGKTVFAASYEIATLRRTALYYGVRPLFIGKGMSTDELLYLIEEALMQAGHFKQGDLVVMTIGVPVVEKGCTNMMKIHTIGGYLPYKALNLRKKQTNV